MSRRRAIRRRQARPDLSGAQVSDSDFAKVLANTTALWIRGEFNTGPDTGSLDNVRWGASQ